MNSKHEGEIILFPKSVDYYQIELTKLLEKESYGKAIRMLEFLLDCKTDDKQLTYEWSNILHWLRNEFPDLAADGAEDEESGASEEEIARQQAKAKASQDREYVQKLLSLLKAGPMDRQMLALDQLAYIEDLAIVPELLERLHEHTLHPFVSFKLLQTLARLGYAGEVTFGKLGEIVTVEVERTPLSQEQFPDILLAISDRVQQAAEIEDPNVSYFAKQTWGEFLAYIYGTALYRELLQIEEPAVDVWTSALHAAVETVVYGSSKAEEKKNRYGITKELFAAWDRAYERLRGFFWSNAMIHV